MCSLDFLSFLHCLWQKGFSTVILSKGYLILTCSTHFVIDFLIECNHTLYQTQLSLWITVASTSHKPFLTWSHHSKYLVFIFTYSNLWSIIGGCIMNFYHHIPQISIPSNLHSLPWSITCVKMANTSAYQWDPFHGIGGPFSNIPSRYIWLVSILWICVRTLYAHFVSV